MTQEYSKWERLANIFERINCKAYTSRRKIETEDMDTARIDKLLAEVEEEAMFLHYHAKLKALQELPEELTYQETDWAVKSIAYYSKRAKFRNRKIFTDVLAD